MILELTAAAMGGGIAGFIARPALTAGKITELQDQRDHAIDARVADILPLANLDIARQAAEALQAHARAADLAATKQSRIDRALEQVTPGANATVQRIARILKGEA